MYIYIYFYIYIYIYLSSHFRTISLTISPIHLHEDTDATRAELEAIFGSKVAELVHRLTDEEGAQHCSTTGSSKDGFFHVFPMEILETHHFHR